MSPPPTARRPLGRTGLAVSPIGLGTVKIGRTQGLKHPRPHDLPTEEAAAELLHAALDLGINLIDTAPAYGLAEERIGRAIAHRRDEFVLVTKAGETFADGRSTFDFSGPALRRSLDRSLAALRCDAVDVLLLHSSGDDLALLHRTDAVPTLLDLRAQGLARFIGLSGKSPEGAEAALAWADVLMVPYNADDRAHEAVISRAAASGVGVLIKKGLGSGHLPPTESIGLCLGVPGVSSLVVGTVNPAHLADNCRAAGMV